MATLVHRSLAARSNDKELRCSMVVQSSKKNADTVSCSHYKRGHCKSENGATKLTVSAWLLETGDPAPRGDLGIFDGSFSPQSDEGAHRGES